MTSDMIQNPQNYKNRVCVAFDKNGRSQPYMYVLVGNHDHMNEHTIRRIYSKTTNTEYFDTRLVLYSTYVKRIESAKKISLQLNELQQNS